MNHRLSQAIGLASILGLALLLPAAASAEEASLPVCADCHEQAVKSLATTKHGAKLESTGAACIGCHGDVAAHLDDPSNLPARRFDKGMTAADKSAACLSCHGGNRALAFWDAGKHGRNDVACSDCHSAHGKPVEPSTGRYVTTQRQLAYQSCVGCHKSIQAQIEKNSHHPIVEGKVSCADCHNPHGELAPAMVKADSVNLLCMNCHTDKRGPFLWSHMPVEENCMSCHTPHGSNVSKLLVEKVPQLCQECHGSGHGQYAYGGTFTPNGADFNRASRFMSRSCINCHQTIHGSNAPASRGQFLIR